MPNLRKQTLYATVLSLGFLAPGLARADCVTAPPSGMGVQWGQTAGLIVASTAPASRTSNTDFLNIPGLSVTLAAGKTYNCNGHLRVTAAGAGGGIKIAFASDGTLTRTTAVGASVPKDGSGTTTK